MNLLTIAWKSIRQRALASSLTGLSVALGVMLMVGVLVIYSIISDAFNQRSFGYHLVVGPSKGSDLQLVLTSIYRVTPATQTLPYRFYRELQEHPLIVDAIPIALGDVTEQGAFPIVGTVPKYFELPYAPGRTFMVRGDGFQKQFNAIIGSRVAQENGWEIGSQFKLVHGGADSGHVHDEKFTVVGVLKQTGTPNDKTVFVPLEGFFAIAGHETPPDEALQREAEFFGETVEPARLEHLREKARREAEAHASGGHAHHHHEIPDFQKAVTAVFVNMKSDSAAVLFAGRMKSGFKAQAVNPMIPMRRLMETIVGNVMKALVVLIGLVIVISGVSIFVSIYNSMADRRREIAIMRALGARRQSVFLIILAESILLCLGGGLLGLALGHGLVFLAAPYVESQTGLIIDPLTFHPFELVLFPVLLVLAVLIGFLPGMTAYRTDVARALAE
jgi:putative ABC transport system permease protein